MKPILKDENKSYYNAYEINLNVEGVPFSKYFIHNFIQSCRDYQVEKALELYLSNKSLKEIQDLFKSDPDELLPYSIEEVNTRDDLIRYALDMSNGEYDFPEDYVDTMVIDGGMHITRMNDNEESFILFPHDKQYI